MRKAASPGGMLQGLGARQHHGVADPGACFWGSQQSQVTSAGSLHTPSPRQSHLLPFAHLPGAGGSGHRASPGLEMQTFPHFLNSELEHANTWGFLPNKGFPNSPVQTVQKCLNNTERCWDAVLNVTIQHHESRNEMSTTKRHI